MQRVQNLKYSRPLLIISNLLFATAWLRVSLLMIAQWRSMPSEVHYDLMGLLLFFAVLWAELLRGG